MRISAKAEYACAAMLELAAKYNTHAPVPIQSISKAQKVPERFLVQILLQLKTVGLVASVRGASGGYLLARTPDAICLADIINAIDDRSISPQTVLKGSGQSPFVEVLLGVWRDVQQQEQRLLESISLAELLRRSQESSALIYQI